MNYQEFSKKPNTDEGCGLFYKDASKGDTKYHILLPLETIPSVQGDYNEMEYGFTTMSVVGKIKGRLTLNTANTDFYWTRDITNKLKSLKGKQLDLLVVLPSWQGYRIKGEISYTYNDVGRGSLVTGSLTITPSWMDENHIDDVSEFCYDTAIITNSLEPNIEVSKSQTSGLVLSDIVTEPTTATISISYYSDSEYTGTGTSSVVNVSDATASGKHTLTFKAGTGATVGSTDIVKLKISAPNYADEEVYIRVVIVE